MLRLRRLWLAVLTSTALIPAVHAQGILDVYGQAAESDPTLQQAAAERLANREVLPQAEALLLPRIDARGDVSQTLLDNEPQFSDSSSTDSRISVSLAQPLYNRGFTARVRQAEAIVDRADAEYVTEQQNLIIRVAERYFDVLARRDDLTFRTADKNAIARQLEQAKRRFEVGLITITDVQEAQAQYDLAVANEIVAINDLADSKEALREVTGVFYDDLFLLSDRVPLQPPEPTDPEVWVQQAMDTSPVLLAASFAAESARENIDVQRSDYYPSLDLAATAADSNNSDEFIRSGEVGLVLNVPIYEGGARSSRVREAAYRYESAKEFLEIQQRNISRQVRDAYRGLQAAISQVKALDQARESNRSALEATEAGFEVGTRTIVDVLNAQRNLFGAERDYAQSRYAYVLNGLRLKRAAGLLAVEDLERINGWLDVNR